MMETVTAPAGSGICPEFGITSLTETDYNAATALGGITKGVSNLELTGAYAAIANGGIYTKPVSSQRSWIIMERSFWKTSPRPNGSSRILRLSF